MRRPNLIPTRGGGFALTGKLQARIASLWLYDHPGGTLEDYLRSSGASFSTAKGRDIHWHFVDWLNSARILRLIALPEDMYRSTKLAKAAPQVYFSELWERRTASEQIRASTE
jgi:hypothetical protein